MNKKIIYSGVSFLLFAVLKYVFSRATVEELSLFLTPVNGALELITSNEAVYQAGVGYLYPEHGIMIGKSCAGTTFFLVCFLAFSLQLIQSGKYKYGGMLPVLFAGSYLLTLFATISRITGSILVLQHGLFLRFFPEPDTLHLITGMAVYLTCLCLTYYLLQITVFKLKRNEEVA